MKLIYAKLIAPIHVSLKSFWRKKLNSLLIGQYTKKVHLICLCSWNTGDTFLMQKMMLYWAAYSTKTSTLPWLIELNLLGWTFFHFKTKPQLLSKRLLRTPWPHQCPHHLCLSVVVIFFVACRRWSRCCCCPLVDRAILDICPLLYSQRLPSPSLPILIPNAFFSSVVLSVDEVGAAAASLAHSKNAYNLILILNSQVDQSSGSRATSNEERKKLLKTTVPLSC